MGRFIFVFLFSSLVLAKPTPPKRPSPTVISTHTLTLSYFSQNRQDQIENEQTTDVGLSSVFQFTDFKITSYLYYYYNLHVPSASDVDDPIFTLTSLFQNVIPTVKLRYYMIGTVGASKLARNVQKQYGTLGAGLGIKLDTEYLKVPDFNLFGTIAASKNFQESEVTSLETSNNNYYTQYGITGNYTYGRWTLAIHFMFFQYFKYVNDESTEDVFQFQDLAFVVAKNHSVSIGHTNRMGFYDDNSGAANFRIFNEKSSYFYVSYTHTF